VETSAPTSSAPAASAASASSAAPAPAVAEAFSFFAGDVPASVKLKPIRTSAIANLGPERLFFTPVQGWPGGSLPGNKYMASKDGVTFRVTDAGGDPVSCASLGSVAAMAPNKVKQLKALGEPRVQSIGKGYLALVGACEGQGPNGRAEFHFAAIEMKESDGNVWNAVLSVNFPEGTSEELKQQAAAWGRSSEFKGPNNRK
jgi:hypothetical protein